MAFGRFGSARLSDDLPLDEWMDGRNSDVAQRQAYEDAGHDAWTGSTGTGENLEAAKPSDVVALGSSALNQDGPGSSDQGIGPNSQVPAEGAPNSVAARVRYVRAKPGDSVSALLGSSEPGAVGRFATFNGMDGRNSTVYPGRVYALPPQGDDPSAYDAAMGDQLLRRDNARGVALRAKMAANDQFLNRFSAGENVWTGEPETAGPAPHRATGARVSPPSAPAAWYDAPLKVGAGAAGFIGGLPYGFVRGGVRTGQALGDALDFGWRLLDPNDAKDHPLDEPARDQLREGAQDLARYARAVVDDPQVLARDIRKGFHDAHIGLDPLATPMADTPMEEMRRQFGIGANVGELGFQLAPVGELSAAGNASRAARTLTRGEKIEKLVQGGKDLETAVHLTAPYGGGGLHFVPRRTRIAGRPLPKSFMDSSFNVYRPTDMSWDETHRFHFENDDYFHGAGLPRGLNGGRGWSGHRENLTRNPLPLRVWNSAPPKLKKAVGGVGALGAVGGLAAYDLSGDDRPQ